MAHLMFLLKSIALKTAESTLGIESTLELIEESTLNST